MTMRCRQCGKIITGKEEMSFCPFCGCRLEGEKPEREKWLKKIGEARTYPERKAVLEKALQELPDDPELEWEALFIGHTDEKSKAVQMSIIKSYLLEIYRTPGDFSRAQRDRMRTELFQDPQLLRCLERTENPQQRRYDYLLRLSKEHISIFLEGNNRIMGNWFGLRTEKRREKLMAPAAASIILRMQQDDSLPEEERKALSGAYYQAFSDLMDGKTSFLEEELARYR